LGLILFLYDRKNVGVVLWYGAVVVVCAHWLSLGTSGFLNLGPAAAYNKYIVESGVRYPQARKYILSEFSQIYK
jgi:hypothetical protein